MKKLCLILLLLCFTFLCFAQESYTVNGESLELEIIEEGNLDLLIGKNNDTYRFFVRDKDDTIHELLNTKIDDDTYNEEYKSVLKNLITNSDISTENVSYGRYGLKHFIKAYNTNDIRSYSDTVEKAHLKSRLSFFGGLTNHPFISNPENAITPYFGSEFEIFSLTKMPRHAGYFNTFYTFENSDLKYTTLQLSLGYRYRFINKASFNVYGNLTFATYNFSRSTFVIDGNEETVTGSAFDVPFIFGLGTDIRLTETSYISLLYNSLFAAFLDHEGNFPMDIALGYKFTL